MTLQPGSPVYRTLGVGRKRSSPACWRLGFVKRIIIEFPGWRLDARLRGHDEFETDVTVNMNDSPKLRSQ